jgi:hypothetical protein
MTSALAPARIRWSDFSPDGTLQQGDVRCEVGDCLFACVAVWLNVALGATLFDAPELRRCLSASLEWPEVTPLLDTLLQELQADLELPRAPSVRQARRMVLRSTTWATHSLMVALASFCSRLLGRRTGFLVLQLTATGRLRDRIEVLPCGHADLELACVLHRVDDNHYRLVAERRGAVLFDAAEVRWLRGDWTPLE